jgi:hypothetical protein
MLLQKQRVLLVAADHGYVTCGDLSGFDWLDLQIVHLVFREVDPLFGTITILLHPRLCC